ncbi:MAG: hypothetical protein C5S45_09340 [Candidatus Methanocomedens sp.]|nr:MAG: hypothetical protein C5S45_09340 [ANME-2 cluster archaeon]
MPVAAMIESNVATAHPTAAELRCIVIKINLIPGVSNQQMPFFANIYPGNTPDVKIVVLGYFLLSLLRAILSERGMKYSFRGLKERILSGNRPSHPPSAPHTFTTTIC